MNDVLNRYATPFTVGLFLVTTISGVALFFHLGSKYFHGMHEWLSMLFLLPVVLHIQKNWSGMKGYFRRKTIWMPTLLSVAGGLVFVVMAVNSPGRPPSPAAKLLGAQPVAALAPMMGLTPASLDAKLAAKGYAAAPGETLATVAKKSGKSLDAVIGDIVGTERD